MITKNYITVNSIIKKSHTLFKYLAILSITLASTKVQSQTFNTLTQSLSGSSTTNQCNDFNNYRLSLTRNDYSILNFRSSAGGNSFTCTNPAIVQSIANALRTSSNTPPTTTWSDAGTNWYIGTCGSSIEFGATTGTPNPCQCITGAGTGILRSCILNVNWGGFNGTTCGAAGQNIILEFGWTSGPPPVLGPLPTISSFTPTSGPIGTSAIVSGTNFSTTPSDNIVYLGSARARITAATANQLTITTPVGLTNKPLAINVNGLTAFSRNAFIPTFANPGTISTNSFTAIPNVANTAFWSSSAIADLNNDGKTDLITCNSSNLNIYQNVGNNNNLGSSSFTLVATLFNSNAYHVITADVDGDGRLDIVCSNPNSNSFSYILNLINPNTTAITNSMFSGTYLYPTSGSSGNKIAAADIDGDGKVDLAITNFSTNNISIMRNTGFPGNPSFSTPITFNAGNSPYGIAMGDIEGDGKVDIVCTNLGSGGVNGLSVFRNVSSSGNINLNTQVNFTTGSSPIAVELADIDGDAKPDMTVINQSSNSISVLRNTSVFGSITSGSFSAKTDFALANSSSATDMQSAELNGDGKLDLVVTCGGNSLFAVFQNNATSGIINSSSLSARVDYSTSGNSFSSVAIGDLDNDNRADLVFNNDNNAGMLLYKNTISIFTPLALNSSIYGAGATIAIPFNITLPVNPGNIFTAQLSDSSGSFASPVSLGSFIGTNAGTINGIIPAGTTIGNNFRVRLVSSFPSYTSSTSDAFRVIKLPSISNISPSMANIGTNITINGNNFSTIPNENIVYFGPVRANVVSATPTTLTVVVPIGATMAPVSVSLLSFTAVSSQVFSPTYIGGGLINTSSFATAVNFTTNTFPAGLDIADIDLDGKADIIIANSSSSSISAHRNISSTGIINTSSLATRFSYTHLLGSIQNVLADIDGDGLKDLIVANNSSSNISVSRNSGQSGNFNTSTFNTRFDFPATNTTQYIATADLDLDGKLDIGTVSSSSNVINIYRNTSVRGIINTNSLATKIDISTGTNSAPNSIAFGDIDNDGLADMIVVNGTSANLLVYRNNSTSGNINFATAASFSVGSSPRSLKLVDLNADGKLDIVVTNSGSASISIFENQTSSTTITLGTRVDLTTGTTPTGIAAGDIDGDGKNDIAVTNQASNTVSVFKNIFTSGAINSASFAAAITYTTNTNPNAIEIADLDADLKPELIVTASGSNVINIFKNTTPSFNTPLLTGQFCKGRAIILPFTASTPFNPGNIFTAQLSDENGSFAAPTSLGSAIGTTSSSINATIPSTANNGTGYRIRIVSSNPTLISTDNLANLTITDCPNITNITPQFGAITSTITINGTGFSTTPANNIVYLGATRATITAATATSINANVPYGANYRPVTVNTNGQIASSKRPFSPTFLAGTAPFTTASFASRLDFNAPTQVNSSVTGDIDGDGKTDIVTVSISGLAMSVYRNAHSTGNFAGSSLSARVNFALSAGAQFTRLADLDGDGKLDVICWVTNGNLISIFRNTSTTGNISFANRIDIPLLGAASPTGGAIADLDNDGKLDIVSANAGISSISVIKNNSSIGNMSSTSFANIVNFTTGFTSPQSVTANDFDDDGFMDLAIGHQSNGISLFRNTGNGLINANTFNLFSWTGVVSNSQHINSADIDGDNKPELIVSNQGSSIISIFRNIAVSGTFNNGSFATSISFATPTNIFSTSVADIDGDGKPDIASGTISTNGIFSVFKNNSTVGTISMLTRVDINSLSASGVLAHMDMGDFDNDGKLDVCFPNQSLGLLQIWRNDLATFNVSSIAAGPYCNGSQLTVNYTAPSGAFNIGNVFTAQLSDNTGSFASPVNIGSVNATNSGSINTVLPINGLAGTAYRVRIVASNPAVTSSDNGTNIILLACPNITSFTPTTARAGVSVTITGNNFNTVANNNTVYFGAVKATVTSASASQLVVTVPNGALLSQISVTSGNYTAVSQQLFTPTFLGNGSINSASLAARADVITGANGITNAQAADLDLDGKPDLISAITTNNVVGLYRNIAVPGPISAASFATGINLSTNVQPWATTTADFDNDGKLDIAAINLSSNNVSVFKNTSTTGSITTNTKIDINLPVNASPYGISNGDVDGDGLIDIVVANLGTNNISVFRNTSSGGTISFSTSVEFTTPNQPASVLVAEMDGDGKADIMVSNFGGNNISVFRNISTSGVINTSSLANRQDFVAGTSPFFMSDADIDGDGKIDIVTPNFSSNTISVFRNTSTSGNINFATKADFTTGASPMSVSIGDIDGDAKADIVVSNNSANSISILKNNSTSGSITLATKVDFNTQTGPLGASICDLDGDGRVDIAIANNNSNSVSIFRNINSTPEPTVQASSVTTTNIGNNSITVNWTNGNGSNRIVVARALSAVNSNPVDETGYTASAVFGSGSQIGTGNFVVYSGNASTVTVTGLNTLTQYHFRVFEFNGSGGASNYLTTAAPVANATTLPVTLVSFNAQKVDETALLTWSTSSETNNSYFEVQRSYDNVKFAPIAKVKGKGNTTTLSRYQFTDMLSNLDPQQELIYYRLKQVDFDGQFEILSTRVIKLNKNNEALALELFPNPANKYINMRLNENADWKYEVCNMDGSTVLTGNVSNNFEQNIDINKLPQGVYYIRVQLNKEVFTKKFVKE